MTEKKTDKTTKKTANEPKQTGGKGKIKPRWKPGESGNPNGRPKGKRNFSTDFKLAVMEVAKALSLEKEPDKVKVQLIMTGLREALKGNFAFWNKFMEVLYEEMREKKGPGLAPDGGLMGVIILPRGKRDEEKEKERAKERAIEEATVREEEEEPEKLESGEQSLADELLRE